MSNSVSSIWGNRRDIKVEDHFKIIDIKKEIHDSLNSMRWSIRGCLQENPNAKIVLNLSDLGRIDTAILYSLLECQRIVQEENGSIALTGLRRGQSLIAIAKLAMFFKIYKNVGHAIIVSQ